MQLQGVAVKGHNGALWEVLPIYQYILDHLYKFDAKYTTDEPTYYRLLRASIQLGIQKCDDYFTATDVEELHHLPLPTKCIKCLTDASQYIAASLKSFSNRYDPENKEMDEYEWYCKQPRAPITTNDGNIEDSFNPIQWWMTKRKQLPPLSIMALDLLGTLVMSNKAERIFSQLGNIVRPNRA
ncbi:MAG: hypothetical protein M1839_003188 [Geoglossum umbratile]|nr:MAG: hypothetical protein M1839_003188 [Geoglossum umbratile]